MNPAPLTPARFRILRIVLGVAAALTGFLIIAVVAALGHCSAFGGTCPAEPPPLLEDDVFGTAFMGGLLAIGAPIWLARPGWRRLGLALAIAVPLALLIGLGARSSAAG